MTLTTLFLICAAISWALGAANVQFGRPEHRTNIGWLCLGLFFVSLTWLFAGRIAI